MIPLQLSRSSYRSPNALATVPAPTPAIALTPAVAPAPAIAPVTAPAPPPPTATTYATAPAPSVLPAPSVALDAASSHFFHSMTTLLRGANETVPELTLQLVFFDGEV